MFKRDEYIYLVKVAYDLCDDKNDLSSILTRFDRLVLCSSSVPVSSLLRFVCYRLIYTCFVCDDFMTAYNYEITRSDFWDILLSFKK